MPRMYRSMQEQRPYSARSYEPHQENTLAGTRCRRGAVRTSMAEPLEWGSMYRSESGTRSVARTRFGWLKSASPERPCASLLLHLHQVVEGTFTPELSNMLGTHRDRGKPRGSSPPTPPYMRVRIRRFRDFSREGRRVAYVSRVGFAAPRLLSGFTLSAPGKLSRS